MEWKRPVIEHGKLTEWGWMVLYPELFSMGENVDIGAFCLIHAQAGVFIGENVKIGSGVKIYSVSSIGNQKGSVIIGDNVSIGANSVIMPGCKISKNAVIGALSFLKPMTNILPYELWCGCPAKRKGVIKNARRS